MKTLHQTRLEMKHRRAKIVLWSVIAFGLGVWVYCVSYQFMQMWNHEKDAEVSDVR